MRFRVPFKKQSPALRTKLTWMEIFERQMELELRNKRRKRIGIAWTVVFLIMLITLVARDWR